MKDNRFDGIDGFLFGSLFEMLIAMRLYTVTIELIKFSLSPYLAIGMTNRISNSIGKMFNLYSN